MRRAKHVIAGLLIVSAASCQLVSGVGDYSFEPSGPGTGGTGATGGGGSGAAGGSGGGQPEVTISWAYQLSVTSGELSLTSLFPAGSQSGILLGHFDGTVQFNNKFDPQDMFTVSATGAENGFLFVGRGGPEAAMAPRFVIEASNGSVVRPQAVTMVGDGFLVAGTVEGDLQNSPLPDATGTKMVVGKWDTSGAPQWTSTWVYGGDLTVTSLFFTGSDNALYIAGHYDGAFTLTADLGTPQGTDGFVAKLDITAMETGNLASRVVWARAFRGAGPQRVVDLKRFGAGLALFGDYAGTMTYHDDPLMSGTELDDAGGQGSLFLFVMDDDGNLDMPKRRFFRSAGGTATAVTIAPSEDGHLLATGHFGSDLTTLTQGFTAAGNQDLFIGEYTTDLSETYAAQFGANASDHHMAGAGYLDVSETSKVAVFAARCFGELPLSAELTVTSDSFDVCTAVLVENPDPVASPRYLPFSLARLGDEQSEGETLDQVPTALVTRGSEVIVYGRFRGSLISPDLFFNNKTEEDGFVFAIDAAPAME